MGLVKYNAKKELKIQLTQGAIKGNLCLSFDRFTALVNDLDYNMWSKDCNGNSNEKYVGRVVEVFVLEMEESSKSKFSFKKPRIKTITSVGKVKIDNPEDRIVFLKDMMNIKEGFRFEETRYYKEWEKERYLACKVEETANELESMAKRK